MDVKSSRPPREAVAATAAIAAAGYAALVVFNRAKYGKVKGPADGAKDSLLDQFIPDPGVVEHHQIDIDAPADVVMATAREMELLKSPVIRAIVKARELALGGEPDKREHPTALLDQMLSIGWVVLAERPGREMVLGAGDAAVAGGAGIPFGAGRRVPRFLGAGIREDRVDASRRSGRRDAVSTFHTETRVCTTDAEGAAALPQLLVVCGAGGRSDPAGDAAAVAPRRRGARYASGRLGWAGGISFAHGVG